MNISVALTPQMVRICIDWHRHQGYFEPNPPPLVKRLSKSEIWGLGGFEGVWGILGVFGGL